MESDGFDASCRFVEVESAIGVGTDERPRPEMPGCSAQTVSRLVWPTGVIIPALLVGFGISMMANGAVALRTRDQDHRSHWVHAAGEGVRSAGGVIALLGGAAHLLMCWALGRGSQKEITWCAAFFVLSVGVYLWQNWWVAYHASCVARGMA